AAPPTRVTQRSTAPELGLDVGNDLLNPPSPSRRQAKADTPVAGSGPVVQPHFQEAATFAHERSENHQPAIRIARLCCESGLWFEPNRMGRQRTHQRRRDFFGQPLKPTTLP